MDHQSKSLTTAPAPPAAPSLLHKPWRLLGRTDERHPADTITGRAARWLPASLLIIFLVIAGIYLWEYLALRPGSTIGRDYSRPSLIWAAGVRFFDLYFDALVGFTWRGLIGILAGFFIVYPLACWMALSGYWSTPFLWLILALQLIPQIFVITFVTQIFGPSLKSVVILSFYSSFVKMLFFGYLHAHFFLRDSKYKELLQVAAGFSGTIWMLYFKVVAPLLFRQRLACLYVLSISVWNSVGFAEAYAGSAVKGLGYYIFEYSDSNSTFANLFAVTGMMILPMAIGWGLIRIAETLYRRYGYDF